MEIMASVCLGVSLSAACGFRVFIPLLVMSIASLSGHLTLASGFEWIGTYPALVVFAAATVCEIVGYSIPWFDNLLDTIAAPAAIIAGMVVMASTVSGVSPLVRWVLAVVAGGGAAGVVQGVTIITRGASTATTGGLGNPVVSTAEAGGSAALSVLAIIVPLVVGIAVLALLVFAAHKLFGRLFKSRSA